MRTAMWRRRRNENRMTCGRRLGATLRGSGRRQRPARSEGTGCEETGGSDTASRVVEDVACVGSDGSRVIHKIGRGEKLLSGLCPLYARPARPRPPFVDHSESLRNAQQRLDSLRDLVLLSLDHALDIHLALTPHPLDFTLARPPRDYLPDLRDRFKQHRQKPTPGILFPASPPRVVGLDESRLEQRFEDGEEQCRCR